MDRTTLAYTNDGHCYYSYENSHNNKMTNNQHHQPKQIQNTIY